MLKNSIVEPDDYLPTERDEGSGSKWDNSMMDNSIAIMDETMDNELDQSLESPGRENSPRKSVGKIVNPEKPKLHNDNG